MSAPKLTSEWIISRYEWKLLDNMDYLQYQFEENGYIQADERYLNEETGKYEPVYMRDCCSLVMEHRMEGLTEEEIVDQFQGYVSAEWQAELDWFAHCQANGLEY